MASFAPINGLPVELLIEVFKSLNSIPDVVHLGSTSRLFYNIWQSFAHIIHNVILPRSIPAYEQVQALGMTVIQRHNNKAARLGKFHRFSQNSPNNKAMLARWLSRAAALQIKAYESDLEQRERYLAPKRDPRLLFKPNNHMPKMVRLTAYERSDFLASYYKLWMLTIMPRSTANAHISSMGVKQMMLLVEFGLRKIIYPTPIVLDPLSESESYWDPLLSRLSRCFVFQILKVVPPGKVCLV